MHAPAGMHPLMHRVNVRTVTEQVSFFVNNIDKAALHRSARTFVFRFFLVGPGVHHRSVYPMHACVSAHYV